MGGKWEGAEEIRLFRDAIGAWAADYSLKHRLAAEPKPTVADAMEDLRRWSREYWSVRAEDAQAKTSAAYRPARSKPPNQASDSASVTPRAS